MAACAVQSYDSTRRRRHRTAARNRRRRGRSRGRPLRPPGSRRRRSWCRPAAVADVRVVVVDDAPAGDVDRARARVDELDPVAGRAAVRLHLVDVHRRHRRCAAPFAAPLVDSDCGRERAGPVRAAAVGGGGVRGPGVGVDQSRRPDRRAARCRRRPGRSRRRPLRARSRRPAGSIVPAGIA